MPSETDDRYAHGLKVVEAVLGAGVRDQLLAASDRPVVEHTIRGLFGDVWDRPGMSVRDRRLLVLGVISTMNRPELIAVQVLAALRNGELDEAALHEAVLVLSYYAGWPNGTAVQRGVDEALRAFRAEGGKP